MGKVGLALQSLFREFILLLPDEFSKFRVRYYNRHGCRISRGASLSPNVRVRGLLEMGAGSSIAQNGSIGGWGAGVFIGENVMIAPNVVIVAFDHGTARTDIPMAQQENVEAPVHIEDDVWISANVTIGKGVRIGKGSIIGANSYVNRDIAPYSIAAGVPAKVIKSRRGDA
ncbi:acyltransferase [Sphingopyxis granuli]|jgi:acetyltransferase-like isoleucine patch superfamily enzyme|uniref:acyltransferase n=1 Tax=Sphingopyxis granuli TaxID=267128 RepID=UPI000830A936|nr:acyltransferase [Sphingopyxis granuli]